MPNLSLSNIPSFAPITPGHETPQTAVLALWDIIRPGGLLHPSVQNRGGISINASGHAAVRPAPACTQLHQVTKSTRIHSHTE